MSADWSAYGTCESCGADAGEPCTVGQYGSPSPHRTTRAATQAHSRREVISLREALLDRMSSVCKFVSRLPVYDEDGYCHWCGNGSWKPHGLNCPWADAQDPLVAPRCEVGERV